MERANLTLQDRLVKELRLPGISTMSASNAYAPAFVADYNRRLGKPPRSDFDAHRPLREEEELDLIFTWREPRKVSHVLTLQYDKTMYLLADSKAARRQSGRYIEVVGYPDGRIELRADGTPLPYATYDRFPVVSRSLVHRYLPSATLFRVINALSGESARHASDRPRRRSPLDRH